MSKPSLMSEQIVHLLSAKLMKQLFAVADEAKLNYGTIAQLIGVSRSRVSQFSNAIAAGQGINVTAHTFLSAVRATKRIAEGMASGELPAQGSKGKAQATALAQLLGQ